MSVDIFSTFLTSPSFYSVILIGCFFLVFAYFLYEKPQSKVSILFEMLFEIIYDFFIDILGRKEKRSILFYVIVLFFLILFINLFWIVLEFFAPIFWMNTEWNFLLEQYIVSASADINFNIAMSIVSICLIIIVQFSTLGLKDFFKNYVPIFGKNYLVIERGESSSLIYVLKYIPVKFFDIVISLFLGALEIIGLVAKIISLSFRLFWNMSSGTVLLALSVAWMSAASQNWFGFSFPVGLPVIIYAQELLIWVIQALVFSLLVAIFIKVARTS